MDSNKFESFLQKQRRKQKEDKYKDSSKGRLLAIAQKKIKTTMIGSLAAIEEELSSLWTPDEDGNLSEEQLYLKDLYQNIRERILDIGNNQSRNLATEFDQYDISWNRYTLNLPVKPEGPSNVKKQNRDQV